MPRPASSLLVGAASQRAYHGARGTATAALLRRGRRGTELRPGRRAAAHRGPLALPADQGPRTGPGRPAVRPGPPLGLPHPRRSRPAPAHPRPAGTGRGPQTPGRPTVGLAVRTPRLRQLASSGPDFTYDSGGPSARRRVGGSL